MLYTYLHSLGILEKRSMHEGEIADICRDILSALHYLHSLLIVHRYYRDILSALHYLHSLLIVHRCYRDILSALNYLHSLLIVHRYYKDILSALHYLHNFLIVYTGITGISCQRSTTFITFS